jgi:hypothetical protein
MGNNCSCKVCIVSCIDKYSDCKDYINKEGKYNEKKPSEIKINTSINIQNILKTITVDTEMKRIEIPQKTVAETKVDAPTTVIETKVVQVSKPPTVTEQNKESPINNITKVETINAPLVKKNNKNSEDEFEII